MAYLMTNVLQVTDDLSFALRLADAADALTMDRFGALDLEVETKPDLTPVSDADRAAEELLRKMIGAEHPDDTIVGEEFGEGPNEAYLKDSSTHRCWIVDPI